MKKMFLSLILTFLITVPVLSLGTDTTIRSMMTLASGKTLLTLRATYDGLWPTSPPLAFFVTTLSDGVLITEYITWAGADRYAVNIATFRRSSVLSYRWPVGFDLTGQNE